MDPEQIQITKKVQGSQLLNEMYFNDYVSFYSSVFGGIILITDCETNPFQLGTKNIK